MGTRGIHTFDDDLNLDWLIDLSDSKPLPFLKNCLDLKGVEEMEIFACIGVLCASVIVDAILNGPTKDLPEDALAWLKTNKKLKVRPLVPAAITGLERLLEDDSEMNSEWQTEKKLYPKWKKSIVELKKRLEKLHIS
jgi:hypothetical protein